MEEKKRNKMEMGDSSGMLAHFYLVPSSKKLKLYLHSPHISSRRSSYLINRRKSFALSTRRHIPQENNLHIHRRENVKSHIRWYAQSRSLYTNLLGS
jgi:hypothetical protein